MLQLENRTPFVVDASVLPDVRGVDTLVLAVKGTFALNPMAVAEEQVPIQRGDVHHGEPGASSLKAANEIHLPKPGTDLILVGSAHAPGGKPVTKLDVSLVVGSHGKSIRVFGDRDWGTGLQHVTPFTTMPLVYERAFGGTADAKRFCALNPVGIGLPGSGDGKRKPLPNLEDPLDVISSPRSQPRPACYGFVPANWVPRIFHAGTYDEVWQRQRAPFLPDDFDTRFFHTAHPDLICEQPLTGGEPVTLVNLSPRGRLTFDLPRVSFDNYLVVQGLIRRVTMQLETVLFEPDEDRLCMLWRCAYPCDKMATRIQVIHVEAEADEAIGLFQAAVT